MKPIDHPIDYVFNIKGGINPCRPCTEHLLALAGVTVHSTVLWMLLYLYSNTAQILSLSCWVVVPGVRRSHVELSPEQQQQCYPE